ncbi:Hydantoin utilization protein C [Listeria monocytogenes N53-1]|nr:Hydantoin utilization protein C [Listeria monocytogenes N53-1]
MAKVGLTVSEDAIGNIYGRLEGPDLPAVIVGSHFDSVPNGGAFDGPAGVITNLIFRLKLSRWWKKKALVLARNAT